MRFIYLIVICIFLQACEEQKKETKYPENEISGQNTEYNLVNHEDIYQIRIPSFMDKSTKLSQFAQLQYFNLTKRFYFIIINEDVSELWTIQDIEREESNLGTRIIDLYMQFQINTFKEMVYEYDYPLVKQVAINGIDARQYEISGKSKADKKKYTYVGTTIQINNRIFFISATILQENFEEFKEVIYEMINSFESLEEVKEMENMDDMENLENMDEMTEEEFYDDLEEDEDEIIEETTPKNIPKPRQKPKNKKTH